MLRSESRSRQAPQMSATPDSTLADPQQVIAELQRQLEERTAERDEALARETATAEVVQVINSSRGDLAPVFDSILDRAMALCDAAFGTFLTYDGKDFALSHLGASRLHSLSIGPVIRYRLIPTLLQLGCG